MPNQFTKSVATEFAVHPDSLFTVLRAEQKPRGNGRYATELLCRCACGEERWVVPRQVRTGKSKSCGCLNRIRIGNLNRSHGQSVGRKRTKAYRAWQSMLTRCTNPHYAQYADYGGRGISVCHEWHGFDAYYADLLPLLPTGETDIPKGLTVDRIKNDQGYKPGNIRLVTRRVQNRNQRQNRVLTIGTESLTLVEWVERYGADYDRVRNRLDRGWELIDALTKPARIGRWKCRSK